MNTKPFPLILLTLILAQTLAARSTRDWTDQEIFAKSHLVIIARAIATKDTVERSTLPNIEPLTKVVGVETTFQTCAVLKGVSITPDVRLHYYRLDERESTNGAMLVEIPPDKPHIYLLFLIKERDGRYAPATGPTDPAAQSVLRLRGATGPRIDAPEPTVHIDRITAAPPVATHSGKEWTYPEMIEKADLVVIGEWSATKEIDERSELPGSAPRVKVIGVTTEFEASLVLKGPKNVKKFGLHHYKFQYEDDAIRPYAPQLVRILEPVHRDGVDYPGGGRFLLFLSKEADGRYAPVTGQTNPGVQSVLNLAEAVD